MQSFSTDSVGRHQTIMFLTELGLYRLLGMSRKPFARPFQKWVAKVVKEIRLTGKYELEQRLTIAAQEKETTAQEHQLALEATAQEHKQVIEDRPSPNHRIHHRARPLPPLRETIKDFDEDKKDAVSAADSTGRRQNIVFLTELAY